MVFGAAAAIIPWIKSISVPYRRGIAGLTVFFGMVIAMLLTSSYHGKEVTGNPEYSNGRFWHTPITGQYPRSIQSGGLNKFRGDRMTMELDHAEATSTEQHAVE